MAEWRFTLGRVEDSANIVIGGDFPSNASFVANWTVSPGGSWAWNNGGGDGYAKTNAVIPYSSRTLRQNILTLGKIYHIHVKARGAVVKLGVYIGKYCHEFQDVADGVIVSVTRKCLGDTTFGFGVKDLVGSSMGIDSVECYEMIWNNPLNDEPIGANDYTQKISRSSELDNIEVDKYINELTFVGDGWAFFKAMVDAGDTCDTIPIRIERKCDNETQFTDYFEGIIYLSECQFDYEKCQVKVNIENPVHQILVDAKDVKLELANFGGDGVGLELWRIILQCHDPSGNYPGGQYNVDAYILKELLHSIVLNATDLNIDYSTADGFFDLPGLFEDLTMTSGKILRIGQSIEPEKRAFSFKEMFDELNKVFNLCWYAVVDIDNVPRIHLISKQISFSGASFITLNNVAKPKRELYSQWLIKNVIFGYKINYLEVGDDGYTFWSKTLCAASEKDFVSELGAQTTTIVYLLDDTIVDEDFDNTHFLIEATDIGAPGGVYESKIYGAPLAFRYNDLLTPTQNLVRWLVTLQSDYYPLVESGTYYPNVVPVTRNIWTFEYPLTDSQINTIFANPISQVTFNSPENGIVNNTAGWILEVSIEGKTGMATFKLLA